MEEKNNSRRSSKIRPRTNQEEEEEKKTKATLVLHADLSRRQNESIMASEIGIKRYIRDNNVSDGTDNTIASSASKDYINLNQHALFT